MTTFCQYAPSFVSKRVRIESICQTSHEEGDSLFSLVDDMTKLSFVALLDSGGNCLPARSTQWDVRIATHGISQNGCLALCGSPTK